MKRRRSSARLGTETKHSNITAVIALSDLHVGSTRALFPKGFINLEGNEIGLNEYQHKMLVLFNKCLQSAYEELAGAKFILALNGDLIDGCSFKDSQVVSKEVADQVNACLEIVKPVAGHKDCGGVVVTTGTGVHVGVVENTIAKALGAIRPPDNKGAYTHQEALFKVRGSLVSLAHHMTGTSRSYLEATAMSVLMGNARLNYARDGLEMPKVFIRSHRHTPGFYSDGRGLFVALGAWQGLTKHARKVVTESKPYPALATLKWNPETFNELPAVKLHGEALPEDLLLF